jgi:hypothetical protein
MRWGAGAAPSPVRYELADTAETLTRIFQLCRLPAKRLICLEATPGIEPGYTVLQTVA